MISILVMTRNEEYDLPGCLGSVAWSDDVHVFDSMSTDRTQEIARQAGAAVTERAFDNYASHRNVALETISFQHPWVLLLDADERIPRALAAEMQTAVSQPEAEKVSAYSIRRKDYLFGRWLKHAQISPFYIRLVRPARAHYTRAINEVIEINGQVETLAEAMDHFPFRKGIAHWIQKHDRYSSMEAELIFRQEGLRDPSLKTAMMSSDFHERRLHQKALFYQLPGRPLIKWMYMMFWRGALLDGVPGVTYATLQSIYEYFIVLKTKELRYGGA